MRPLKRGVITMIKFSNAENYAITRCLEYWISNWDCECPTLFGLRLSDFSNIAKDWPDSYVKNQEIALLACLDSFRELLYGASALPKNRIKEQIGLSYKESSELVNRISKEYEKFEL